MKEKVIEILKNSDKKLDAIEIMHIIKENSNVEDYEELMKVLGELCRDGIIRTANGNAYVMNELLTGTVDLHDRGNAHVIVPGHKDIFISRDHMNGALDKDKVIIDYISKEKNEGRVVKVINRSLGRQSAGEVINDNGRLYVKVLDETLPYKVEVDISQCDFELVDGLLVHLVYVNDITKGKILARPDYALGHKNGIKLNGEFSTPLDTTFALIGSEFKRRVTFPKEVLDEAKVQKTQLDDSEVEEELRKGRTDLMGETIVTIDGKDTKDIDDGINTEFLPNGNSLETVAIADVTNYVRPGSAMWQYAEEKGNSDYWGNRVAPMLPVELSNGICSLNPNEAKLSVVVQYELTPSGERLHPNVFLAVIRSKKKMNYDAVQDIIDEKTTEDTKDYVSLAYTVKENETPESIAFKYGMTLEKLQEANPNAEYKAGDEINIPARTVVLNHYRTSKIIEAALKRRGKVDFEGREVKHEFDENDNVIGVHRRVQRPAERVIENKMIYANEAFADFMISRLSKLFVSQVPFVYRTHGEPNPKKIEEFLNMVSAYGVELPINIDPNNVSARDLQIVLEALKDQKNYTAFNHKLLRCMQAAGYTSNNYGHFGIGSKLYCHYTSPIRRFADLLVHEMFKELVVNPNPSNDRLVYWANYLDVICDKITECERNADECEYAINDLLNALYLQDKIGSTFEATVDGMLPSCFFVSTDECIDGRVDFYLTEKDTEAVLKLETLEDINLFIEQHKKSFSNAYDYNENLYGYSRNGKMYLRYGDRVLVACSGANPEKREIDFTLLRKL